MSSPSSANKFDGGKLPMHLLPPEVEEALATVLGPGAKKYGERNWEQGGLSWDRLYGAMRRHLGPAHLYMTTGGRHGEWIDADTGVPHIFCCLAELAFAITYVKRGMIEVPAEPSKPEPARVPGFYRRPYEEAASRRRAKGRTPFDDLSNLPEFCGDRLLAQRAICLEDGAVADYYEEVK